MTAALPPHMRQDRFCDREQSEDIGAIDPVHLFGRRLLDRTQRAKTWPSRLVTVAGLRAVATTLSPWPSAASAISTPKPRNAPVMNQVLPMGFVLLPSAAQGRTEWELVNTERSVSY
jgi:hypothetical protein